MMKILLLSKYGRKGASSRLRTLQFIPMLRDLGFHFEVQHLFGDEYLDLLYATGGRNFMNVAAAYVQRFMYLMSRRKANYELVWIEKELFPYVPALVEKLLLISRTPYIVDYDDAIFHNYDLAGHWWIRKLLGGKIDELMKGAACVVAGNAYLAARAKSAGAKRVEVIPTVVDYCRYSTKDDGGNAHPVIGWIGSPATQRYIVEIRDALIRVCSRYGVRLLLVGATPQVSAHFGEIDVQIVPWSEGTEAQLIRSMDVGIMPLDDGPWERGKCGYKLIQYMAAAVPVVASPVGVNVDIVERAQCGLLAKTAEDWEAALGALIASASQRKLLGNRGRRAVENIYSLQVQGPILARIFREERRGGR